MEEAIIGDFALIKAWKADRAGNLTFRWKLDSYVAYLYMFFLIQCSEKNQITTISVLKIILSEKQLEILMHQWGKQQSSL